MVIVCTTHRDVGPTSIRFRFVRALSLSLLALLDFTDSSGTKPCGLSRRSPCACVLILWTSSQINASVHSVAVCTYACSIIALGSFEIAYFSLYFKYEEDYPNKQAYSITSFTTVVFELSTLCGPFAVLITLRKSTWYRWLALATSFLTHSNPGAVRRANREGRSYPQKGPEQPPKAAARAADVRNRWLVVKGKVVRAFRWRSNTTSAPSGARCLPYAATSAVD
jgi:hypothetical protein